ncbi:hypothetical protein SKTS_32500 [Sulfurimicrobium lacus]|uniref:Conserved hypothetical protein CHP03032 domain-containing protein n=1 Tax=Sulfurimicrobium lacus TaxID=2715678 RepID=A0A6F8VFB1_9PROT|nr:DUF4915 domain-containing protein [Sulfurimicrobium lacus]BCB28364.1 hypothetical protein SKTS_32500 [Sulfurimicrobium lacus]
MQEPFTQDMLLATSPNAGGTSLIALGTATVIDQEDTTGIWISEGGLFRNVIASIPDDETPHKRTMQLQSFSSVSGKKVLMEDEQFDFHDILYHENRLYLVSTGTNEVITLTKEGAEIKRYSYPGHNDSWHINCLGIWDGRVVVSAFGEFDSMRGYKHNSTHRGFIMDLESGQKLWEGLSQPHTPVQRSDKYYVCNSESKQVLIKDRSGNVQCLQFDSYTRGLAFGKEFMYVGLSQSRNVEHATDGPSTARIVAVNILTNQICGEISLPYLEIYDVRIVQNEHYFVLPMMLGLNGEDLRKRLHECSCKAAGLAAGLNRIKSHIITGSIIRLVSRLKKDNTFANPSC